MVRFSNGIITVINLLTLLVSFLSLGLALWFFIKVGTPCERMLRTPLLVVGGGLLLVSLTGLLGACCRVALFMWLYLITLFFLVVGLIAFTAFAIAVTNKGIGQALSERGVGNGRLGDDSWWIRNYVISEGNWERIKGCLIDMRLCRIAVGGNDAHEEFYRLGDSSSLIQSGCCMPPNSCGSEFVNGSNMWKGTDCKEWSNEGSKLCYNCESCKTAVLNNIKKEWRMLAIINTLILISITVIYTIGCCALRNNQNYGYTKYTGYYA